jgi:hypothetical protein
MPQQKPPRVLTGGQILAIEAVIYSVLVAAYLLLVLRTLAPVLLEQATRSRGIYAAVCLFLMFGQGVFLEFVTTWLVARYARAHRQDALDALEKEEK